MAKQKKEETSINSDDASKGLLNSLLNGYKDTHYNFVNSTPVRISSGSLLLDSAVKVMSGQIIKAVGSAELGKTSQAMLFCKNYMETMPKSKCIYVNAEAKFGEDIKNRTGLKYVEKADEWTYGTVFILHTNIFDTICDTLEAILRKSHELGEHIAVVIDSMDMLTLASSLDSKASAGKKPAGVNYLSKELFRRLGHPISKYNALLIMICQYSQTFTMSQYEKEAPKISVGNATHALNHSCSVCLEYSQRYSGDYITEKGDGERPDFEKNKILGVFCRVGIKKSTTNTTNYTIQVPIKFQSNTPGNNVWRSKEIGDIICMWQLAAKGGAWLTFDPSIVKELKDAGLELKEKVNGINALYDYLEENPLIMDYFYQKFSKMLSQS